MLLSVNRLTRYKHRRRSRGVGSHIEEYCGGVLATYVARSSMICYGIEIWLKEILMWCICVATGSLVAEENC